MLDLTRLADSRAGRLAFDFRFILVACSLVVAGASVVKYVSNPVVYDGLRHASYNNFVIFRNSFLNLINHRDLYAWHLDQQWDLYKYSPSFAVFMLPFAFLPTLPGLVLWSLLNTIPLLVAIRMLPLDTRATHSIIYLVFIELVTSIQSAQSNGLVAALFLFAFVMLERRQIALASLFTVLNISIKVFGLAGFLLFPLYPRKGRAAIYTVAWVAAIGALPLLFVGPRELAGIYGQWFALLREDTVRANLPSFYGWLSSWFHVTPPRQIVLLLSTVLLLLPLARVRAYGERNFRLLFLASVLIWVVIFNHKAESPTFVIAMCGVAIWFFASPASTLNRVLLAIAFVLVPLSNTDVFPRALRQQVFIPYSLKAVPCIVIWFLISAQMLLGGGAGVGRDCPACAAGSAGGVAARAMRSES